MDMCVGLWHVCAHVCMHVCVGAHVGWRALRTLISVLSLWVTAHLHRLTTVSHPTGEETQIEI